MRSLHALHRWALNLQQKPVGESHPQCVCGRLRVCAIVNAQVQLCFHVCVNVQVLHDRRVALLY